MNAINEFLKENGVLILSIITAFLTSGVSVLTAYLTTRDRKHDRTHELNLKEYEFLMNTKSRAYENYLNAVISYAKNRTADTFVKYNEMYGRALIYAGSDARSQMSTIDCILNAEKIDEKRLISEIENLCSYMQIDMERGIKLKATADMSGKQENDKLNR